MPQDTLHLIKLETSVLPHKYQNNLLLEAAVIKYKGGATNKMNYRAITGTLHCVKVSRRNARKSRAPTHCYFTSWEGIPHTLLS